MKSIVVLVILILGAVGGCEKKQSGTLPEVTEYLTCPVGTGSMIRRIGEDRYRLLVFDGAHTGEFSDIEIEFDAGPEQEGKCTPLKCKAPAGWSALLKHLGGTKYSIDIADYATLLKSTFVLKFDTHHPRRRLRTDEPELK